MTRASTVKYNLVVNILPNDTERQRMNPIADVLGLFGTLVFDAIMKKKIYIYIFCDKRKLHSTLYTGVNRVVLLFYQCHLLSESESAFGMV